MVVHLFFLPPMGGCVSYVVEAVHLYTQVCAFRILQGNACKNVNG